MASLFRNSSKKIFIPGVLNVFLFLRHRLSRGKTKKVLFDKVYTCDYKLMSHYECKNVKCKKMQPISVALRSFSNSAIFKSISSLNIIWVILPFQIIHCTVIRGIEIFYLYIYSRG